MAADYETRLGRLEMAQGVGVQQFLVVLPGEDEVAKLAEFRRGRWLADDQPVRVMRVVFAERPLSGRTRCMTTRIDCSREYDPRKGT